MGSEMCIRDSLELMPEIIPYTPFIMAVLIGGTIGNVMSIKFLKPSTLRRITGLLILAVAIRLTIKWLGLMAIHMA